MPPRILRLPEETDPQFRQRADRAAHYARLLVNAALSNHDVRALIADPAVPSFTEAAQRSSPTVRIEYAEAYAIAGIGEGLYATRNKHWGESPYIHPLSPDDPVNPMYILYVHKDGSRYNRRYEQRRRLKELLGRRYRSLVGRAVYRGHTQAIFLANLTDNERRAIERILKLTPRTFWRGCRGRTFLTLPPRLLQLALPFRDDP